MNSWWNSQESDTVQPWLELQEHNFGIPHQKTFLYILIKF